MPRPGTQVATPAASGCAAPVVVVTAADGPGSRDAAMSYGAAGLLGTACLGSGAVLVLRRRRA